MTKLTRFSVESTQDLATITLRVLDGYDVKDTLKTYGYQYEPVQRTWYKEFDNSDGKEFEKETHQLRSLGIRFMTVNLKKSTYKKGDFNVEGLTCDMQKLTEVPQNKQDNILSQIVANLKKLAEEKGKTNESVIR